MSSNHLRHVESMSLLPSGAGKISQLNAVVLGESIASEENDLVFPSKEFSSQALVSSPQQYMEMHKRSMEDPAGFWSDIASEFFWKQKWGDRVVSENLDVRKGPIHIEVCFFFSCLVKMVDISERSWMYQPVVQGGNHQHLLQLLRQKC